MRIVNPLYDFMTPQPPETTQFSPPPVAMQSTSSVSNLLAFFSLDRPNSSPLLAPGRGVEQYIDPDVLFGPGGRRPLKTSKEKV